MALGGGSTIGLGKALALRTDLPQIAVPATYAGSETTSILGETEGGRKTTQRSPKVLPETVIYDVELTLSFPPGLSATSGVNALAHAVEALFAHDGNPIITLMAEDGIAALGRSLPRIVLIRPIRMRGRTPNIGLGCAAPAWARSPWPCTTRSATCWAARSTCGTPRRTRSCCRT